MSGERVMFFIATFLAVVLVTAVTTARVLDGARQSASVQTTQ